MGNLPDPLFILVALTTIGLLPFLALMVSSFTKIVIVLGLLRQALGTQQVPPNMVLNGMALILTMFIMAPVISQGWENLDLKNRGAQFGKRFDDLQIAMNAVEAPLKGFLDKHVQEHYRKFFIRAAKETWPKEKSVDVARDDMVILVPSFMVTEVTAAFQIGFVLYLAFIVIDLVIANILLALGMMMTSPTLISIPFKLLLFIALDGWSRLLEALVLTYR
ncbi:MAG TPA: type III secretion system export apparatus subunit SctR [Noviherbaspirillum sp.]|nr:type III secretion system export apparatus subunit SctR [Noviherbaspirillum sp.]